MEERERGWEWGVGGGGGSSLILSTFILCFIYCLHSIRNIIENGEWYLTKLYHNTIDSSIVIIVILPHRFVLYEPNYEDYM